jgi:hypothetical protein
MVRSDTLWTNFPGGPIVMVALGAIARRLRSVAVPCDDIGPTTQAGIGLSLQARVFGSPPKNDWRLVVIVSITSRSPVAF